MISIILLHRVTLLHINIIYHNIINYILSIISRRCMWEGGWC